MSSHEIGVTIRSISESDIRDLTDFLSLPEIDSAFKKPLSQRPVSIGDRVRKNHETGTWVCAFDKGRILACLASLPDFSRRTVELSTFAVRRQPLSFLAGKMVYETAVWLSRYQYNALKIRCDSWEGNTTISTALLDYGFRRVASYLDPEKRPAGIKTVIYEYEFTGYGR